jgi:DNA-binding response OmpR family regulator
MNEQKYGRILVVEDDPDATMLAQYTLQQEGYDVVVANDGATGLDIAFSDQRVDLIVLDIMLPDIDGFEVCSQLKNHRKTKQTPVLMLTAKNTDEDMIRGMDVAYAEPT